jgi:hypothetical protein
MPKIYRTIPAPHDGHHALSPSSGHRWWNCPASIWLEEKVREAAVEMPENEAAIEGTAAHAEAEAVLRGEKPRCTEFEPAQMYVDYVRETLADPLIEVNLPYHDYLPESGGTADAVGVQGGTLHVIDLKYGMGKVEARDNMQGKLYLLGAYQTLGWIYEFDRMEFHIVQPRLDWIDAVGYSVDEIAAFGEQCKQFYRRITTTKQLIPQPGEGQCRWCDAAAVCAARAEYMMEIARGEFTEVDDESMELHIHLKTGGFL